MSDRIAIRAALIIARAALRTYPFDIRAAQVTVTRLSELAPNDAQQAVTSAANAIEVARIHDSVRYSALARFALLRLIRLLEQGLIRAPQWGVAIKRPGVRGGHFWHLDLVFVNPPEPAVRHPF